MPEWMHLTISRLKALVTGGRLDAELQQEIDEHVHLLTEEYRVEGSTPAEARRKALMKLGGATATRELHRETRSLPWVESFFQDIRYSFRTFVREPGYFSIAVLIIGLGIGAASSVFGVVNTLVLKPLPFPDSDRLVWIANDGDGGLSSTTLRAGNLGDWRELAESFEELGGYFAFFEYTSVNLYGEGQPERIRSAAITESFLSTLGVTPQLGRDFVEEEAVFNGRPAVLLSDGYWRRRFGADPDVIGRQLNLGGGGFTGGDGGSTVVGVLPASFDFASVFRPGMNFDVFTPFPVSPETHNYGNAIEVVARLKPGATVETAQGELDRINEQLKLEQPDRWGIVGILSPLQGHVNGRFRPALLLLSGAVGLLLLIACTNLSNLLLVRASSRRKEIALRSALGARRSRIIRQMLTESLVLAACGSLLGIAVAFAATRFVASLSILNIPLLSSVVVDGRVLAFSIGAALVCGLLFGMVPALQVSVSHEADALKESGRGTSDGKDRAWLRSALVIAETALACVLLVGAGLLLRSFWTILEVDPGFRPEQTAAWQIGAQDGVSPAERSAYLSRLARSVEAIPGIVSVGLTDALPLGASRSWGVRAKGVVYEEGEAPGAFPRLVDGNYAPTMGIPLVAGVGITPQDDMDSELVALVNESMAAGLWLDQDPIGQIVAVNDVERVVRGVVGDVRHSSLEKESGNEVYLPVAQTRWTNQMQMVVRASVALEALAPSVRQALAQEDPLLPVNTFQVLSETVDRSLSPRKFTLWLIGAFSIAALALASLGIYGVVSYSVNQRTQEIGIRMALGANASAVRSQIVSRTLVLASIGIAIGVLASYFLARTITSLLYGVSATDPWTFGVMAALLMGVAAAAGFVPAYRISHADLASVLRSA